MSTPSGSAGGISLGSNAPIMERSVGEVVGSTYEAKNLAGARWRRKELPTIGALTALPDRCLRVVRQSMLAAGLQYTYTAAGNGIAAEVDGVQAWVISDDAVWTTYNAGVPGEVALPERVCIAQSTAGLTRLPIVHLSLQASALDSELRSVYFDFAVFIESFASDYIRKRTRFLQAALGCSPEAHISQLRSYVAPNDRTRSMG
jgi:hypothetical protein